MHNDSLAPVSRAVAAVLFCAVLLVGCGSGSGSDASTKDGSSGGTSAVGSGSEGGSEGSSGADSACGGDIYVASVCAEIDITGASTLSDTALSPVGGAVGAGEVATCASWAEGSDGELEFPLFLDGTAEGTRFGMESLVTDYTGPGTYDVDSLSGRGSKFTIVVGDLRYQPSAEGTSTAELTVSDDGSGSLEASGFVVEDGSGGVSDPIDASISWTCVDA